MGTHRAWTHRTRQPAGAGPTPYTTYVQQMCSVVCLCVPYQVALSRSLFSASGSPSLNCLDLPPLVGVDVPTLTGTRCPRVDTLVGAPFAEQKETGQWGEGTVRVGLGRKKGEL